ncbi:MAG: MBL fold metallo-hydrolase [Porticoccaceae bacterium]
MRFASLGSGSKGNATLVEWGDTCVMVDCGFSVKQTVQRLAQLQRQPEDLSAILVTHEHSDHIKGVLPLARRFGITVMMTAGTAKAAKIDASTAAGLDIQLIDSDRVLAVGGMQVSPVSVPHDAREPVQFVFCGGKHRIGILTDLGSITPHVVEQYSACDGFLVEANHDRQMLDEGSYPYSLKQRVGGDWGHLNNGQTAQLLDQIDTSALQVLVVGHISQQNNSLACVEAELAPVVAELPQTLYACQDQGFAWQSLE